MLNVINLLTVCGDIAIHLPSWNFQVFNGWCLGIVMPNFVEIFIAVQNLVGIDGVVSIICRF